MSEEMKMTVSGVINKKGKKAISVLFTDGPRSAEGMVPDGKIYKNQGFSEEEIAALELYLRKERNNIIEIAKKINAMKAFMGERHT